MDDTDDRMHDGGREADEDGDCFGYQYHKWPRSRVPSLKSAGCDNKGTIRRATRESNAAMKADTRNRHRTCTPVYCWVCGHREWRLPVKWLPLAMRPGILVMTYGRCAGPLPYEDKFGCDGLMVKRADRRMVLMDAIKYDEAGGTGGSEYDL